MPLNNFTIVAQCTEYSIESFGGTEVLVATLIRQLPSRYKIVLVSDDDSEMISQSALSPRIHAHIRWSPEVSSPETARALAQELCRHKVDLAHFHFGGNYRWNSRALNRCPLVYVHRAGIRCLSTNHGVFGLLDDYCASWRPLWLKLALLPAAWAAKMQVISHFETEIAVSRHDLRRLQRWYWPFRAKFRQIYHSKLQEEPPEVNRVRKKIIICVGTIGSRKGQPVLCEAFEKIASRYPEWNLILAGRAAEPELMAKIETIRSRSRLEDRIQLVDNLSDKAIAELMQSSEIFAMPSLQEGLGLSLQEALFYGCVCVGSRVGGIPELLDHGINGLLVSPSKPIELAAALDQLMSDENLRTTFRARGAASILQKGMTAEQMLKNYEAIYSELMPDHSNH